MLSLALATSVALVACNDTDGDGIGDVLEVDVPDNTDPTDTFGATTSTAGVECDYMDVTYNDSVEVQAESRSTWSCPDVTRELNANGIPDHDVGPFGGGGNQRTISEQDVTTSYTLNPETTDTATELGGPRGPTGYVLNGVKMDPGTSRVHSCLYNTGFPNSCLTNAILPVPAQVCDQH